MGHPWKHFCTITKHRHKVIVHCLKAGLGWQGLLHDLSKYSPTEFRQGARYYQGTRSPNDIERRENGCSQAWMHHKGRNKHHFEYWTDYHPVRRRMEAVEMPTRYLIEMLCDRMAASKTYQGKAYTDESSLQYFLNGNARYAMHPKTAERLEILLRQLAEEGEAAVFATTRRWLKEEKKK